MDLLKKLALAILVLSGTFGAGYFAHKPEVKTQTQTIEKIVTKTVTKTTQPDGTTVVTSSETVQDTATSKDSEVLVGDAYRPDYSVAVVRKTDVTKFDKFTYEAQVGYRALGNSWVVASYDWVTHQVGLGIRLDF